MDLGYQRVYLIDRTFLRMWTINFVPRRVIFWSSLKPVVPGILSKYFFSPFLMTPGTPITTGIVSVSIFHILAVSSSNAYLNGCIIIMYNVLLLLSLLLPVCRP